MTRKPMPDIISDLLQSKPDTQPAEQKASTPVSQQAGIPVHQHRRPARKKTAPPPEESKPVKATFYLSQETVDALEDAWIQLRRMAPADIRGTISKSGIVEEAIRAAAADFKDRAEKSRLVNLINGGK